jgi:hypothetical protein
LEGDLVAEAFELFDEPVVRERLTDIEELYLAPDTASY